MLSPSPSITLLFPHLYFLPPPPHCSVSLLLRYQQVLAFVSQVHNVELPEDAVDLDSVQLGQVSACHCSCMAS